MLGSSTVNPQPMATQKSLESQAEKMLDTSTGSIPTPQWPHGWGGGSKEGKRNGEKTANNIRDTARFPSQRSECGVVGLGLSRDLQNLAC